MMCQNQGIQSKFEGDCCVVFVAFDRPSEEDALNGKFSFCSKGERFLWITNCLGIVWECI